MEADEDGVTAKNTYGGPLLLRTEFSNTDETTYEYMYNAHGDVVTLISDGEVVATYTYDSFGNILEQTGEVDNSILYAGYQYDEETGLYYINARMYDPVTARFLQADTYLGATNDPLSLNLYTYCLNNPHKYVDPSGHFAITVAGVLMALRIGISAFSGWMSAKAEYDRQVAEGDNNIDWTSVFFVGAANAGVSFFSFGAGSGAAMAGTGIKAVVKHVGKAMIREAAIGALTDAGIETTRQLITGTGITNLEYDRITEAGVCGGIAGGVGTLAGAGLQGLLNTRVARSAIEKLDLMAHKGAGAIKRAFGELATDNSGAVDLDAFKNVGKSGRATGTYGELVSSGQKDAHHIIQDAAMRDIPGYNRMDAPAIQLEGPSNVVGTEHYYATVTQRRRGGGTYGSERGIAYMSLRKAGLSVEDAKTMVRRADGYFMDRLGLKLDTPTRIPGNRRK